MEVSGQLHAPGKSPSVPLSNLEKEGGGEVQELEKWGIGKVKAIPVTGRRGSYIF
jgi:hypothetical protein